MKVQWMWRDCDYNDYYDSKHVEPIIKIPYQHVIFASTFFSIQNTNISSYFVQYQTLERYSRMNLSIFFFWNLKWSEYCQTEIFKSVKI